MAKFSVFVVGPALSLVGVSLPGASFLAQIKQRRFLTNSLRPFRSGKFHPLGMSIYGDPVRKLLSEAFLRYPNPGATAE